MELLTKKVFFFKTSLISEYFKTLKHNVGPFVWERVILKLIVFLAVVEREKIKRCDTPNGPAMSM